MTLDLNTFLTALYTIVDDSYKRFLAQNKPSRPGKRPEVSDSEVLTLMLCAQWSGKSERRFVAYVAEHWGSYFPRMLTQSAFNRRSRDLAGVVVGLSAVAAEQLGAHAAAYQSIDSVPVPLMRRCRGKRHRLFGDDAAIGKGGQRQGFLLRLQASAWGIARWGDNRLHAGACEYRRPLGCRELSVLASQSARAAVQTFRPSQPLPEQWQEVRGSHRPCVAQVGSGQGQRPTLSWRQRLLRQMVAETLA